MGFDTERSVVSSGKFSVSSKKHKHSSNNVGDATAGPGQKITVAGKDVKGNDCASSPGTPPLFPSSDSRKRLFHLPSISSSSEGSPKSARIDGSKPPNSNDNFCNAPRPKSLNARVCVVPSFGNIYRASRNNIAPGMNGNMGAKLSKSNVLGFGGCNYGHGSIVKAVTTVEKLKNAGNEEYRRGRYKEAISYYDKAIGLNCENEACHNNKAAALAGLGKFTEAVGECLQAINYHPSYSRAHYRLATLYTRLGHVNEAKWHLKQSGHDVGSEAMQRLLHVEVHYINMQKAREVEDWDLVLKESTLCIQAGADASNQVLVAKAESLLKLHRAKEALEFLMAVKNLAETQESKSRKSGEEAQRLLIIETQINLYLGRFEEGVVAAEEAVKLEARSWESMMWLRKAKGVADARTAGNEYYKRGKYREASSTYGQGLEHDPTNCVLLCNRAACRSKLGEWEMAIDDCNAALRNRPDYSKALLRRAYSNARLGRWEEISVRDYSVLRKEMPGDDVIADALLPVQMQLNMPKPASTHPPLTQTD